MNFYLESSAFALSMCLGSHTNEYVFIFRDVRTAYIIKTPRETESGVTVGHSQAVLAGHLTDAER